MILPKRNWNFPECLAEYSLEAKKKKATEIYEYLKSYKKEKIQFVNILERCQFDFKLASLVAYKLAVDTFLETVPILPVAENLAHVEKSILPVFYAGSIGFSRVFSINHCAFSSPDSIIGFRDAEKKMPSNLFKILKGLKFIGTHDNWFLFKLDRDSTDDMTGMLATDLDKNFTVEFAHFPHHGERRVVYRWCDC